MIRLLRFVCCFCITLLNVQADPAIVLSHKSLSSAAKEHVQELRKITHQIEHLKVRCTHVVSYNTCSFFVPQCCWVVQTSDGLAWESVCAATADSTFRSSPACARLSPQVWFAPFFPHTDVLHLTADAEEDSEQPQQQPKGLNAACVEEAGPCAAATASQSSAGILKAALTTVRACLDHAP